MNKHVNTIWLVCHILYRRLEQKTETNRWEEMIHEQIQVTAFNRRAKSLWIKMSNNIGNYIAKHFAVCRTKEKWIKSGFDLIETDIESVIWHRFVFLLVHHFIVVCYGLILRNSAEIDNQNQTDDKLTSLMISNGFPIGEWENAREI